MIAKRKRYTNREVNDTSQRIATMDEEPIELNEGTQHAVGKLVWVYVAWGIANSWHVL
jgi:hypothetical protein